MISEVLAWLLGPIVTWLLLSGIDDLFVCLVCAWQRVRGRGPRPEQAVERAIAVFVPCWREEAVIARMVEHNIARIRYRNYHFFIGAYPNDEGTVEAVRELEEKYPNVHLSLCLRPGPTSKADCLNCVFRRMLRFEEERGARFEIVVTHDAEDLIHPHAFSRINGHIGTHDMVQVPVLPLDTPAREFTHGVYCDEFADYQIKDAPARPFLGAFLPSNGVGTGYARDALDRLAANDANRIFEAACLTEDYENGIRLHRLGCSQLFLPLAFGTAPEATRELFPQTFRKAVRQRTRWIMGIALQGWERYGWGRTWAERYWFWRDRKGLVGNAVSLLANLLFVCGLLAWSAGGHWPEMNLAERIAAPVVLGLSAVALSFRAYAVGRIYGWAFALGVPLRAPWANVINFTASVCALYRYGRSKWRREPLVWLKTDHSFPSAAEPAEQEATVMEDVLAG